MRDKTDKNKVKIKLYDAEGNEFIFRYPVDAVQAIESGHFFEENPKAKKEKKEEKIEKPSESVIEEEKVEEVKEEKKPKRNRSRSKQKEEIIKEAEGEDKE